MRPDRIFGLLTAFPRPIRIALFHATSLLRRVVFYGRQAFCPICKSHLRRFYPWGVRDRAWCPVCGSLERQRMAFIFLSKPGFLTNKRLLHIAPSPSMQNVLKTLDCAEYVTADLNQTPRIDLEMDITDIQYPDESFDVVYASHVLEHVNDDIKAMSELHRVLRRRGVAILFVPIFVDKTIEDVLDDPQERKRLYGQHDHVRAYGLDIVDRLRSVNFNVQTLSGKDFSEIARHGIRQSEYLFIAKKA